MHIECTIQTHKPWITDQPRYQKIPNSLVHLLCTSWYSFLCETSCALRRPSWLRRSVECLPSCVEMVARLLFMSVFNSSRSFACLSSFSSSLFFISLTVDISCSNISQHLSSPHSSTLSAGFPSVVDLLVRKTSTRKWHNMCDIITNTRSNCIRDSPLVLKCRTESTLQY